MVHILVNQLPPPTAVRDVRSDGSCLYRAVSLSISGLEDGYRELRFQTAAILHTRRAYILALDIQADIDRLISEALTDGGSGFWGNVYHILALTVVTRVPINVLNYCYNPPVWECYKADEDNGFGDVQVFCTVENILFN